MATHSFVDQVLDRVGDLISELHHRFTDGSTTNSDVPSYTIRLDASMIQEHCKALWAFESGTVYHEIITGLQELKNLLSQSQANQARQRVRAGYSTPRRYTGRPGQPQFYIARDQLEFLVKLNLSGSKIANLLGVSE